MAGTLEPMTDAQFWQIVNATLRFERQPMRQLQALETALSALDADGIVAFHKAFEEKLRRANRWTLWGAAYVMNGGCSDDGFHDFRAWLISKGRSTYEAAIEDPDCLANAPFSRVDGVYEFEQFGYAALEAWQRKTGRDPTSLGEDNPFLNGLPVDDEPKGNPFEEDDAQLAKAYPRLWARNH